MTITKTGLAALGLAVVLTPAAHRALAAGPFDGTYAGPQHETRNNNSGYCQNINRDSVRLTVKDNVIKYQWGQIPLEATVAGDGSFSVDRPGMASRGASSVISLTGRISGGNLEADVGGSACGAHVSLKKA